MTATPVPTFTVVVPLHDKAGLVSRALRSVLAQTWPALELIVVDDGSTDAGPAEVTALTTGWPGPPVQRVRQANAGVAVARNRGIALARGEFVAFLDADDAWLPGHLAALADLALQYPDAGFLAAGYRRVWPDGRSRDEGLPQQPAGARLRVPDFFAAWCRHACTHTNSIAVRRTVLAALPTAFPPGERLGEDQDLWFRLAETTPLAYVNQVQSIYHLDVPGSACTTAGQVLDLLPCYERLARRVASGETPAALRPSARRLLASHRLNVARARAEAGRPRDAWALLLDRRALHQPVYWCRTAAWLVGRSFGIGSGGNGRATR
ncbi:glycosyltransferase family 2 protein [Leptothrix sp. BB-4]